MSEFFLAVGRHDGATVKMRPGAQSERDLVDEIVSRARGKGIGYFVSESQVVAAIEESVKEAIMAIKSDVRP
jgi:hypothetical protein